MSLSYNKDTQLGAMVSQLVNGTIQMQFLANRIKNIMLNVVQEDSKLSKLEDRLGLLPGEGREFLEIVTELSYALNSVQKLSKLDLG